MKWDKVTSAGIAVCGSMASRVFGSWDLAFQTLVILMAIDYLTGIGCAYQLKTISSRVGMLGIFKKIMMLAVIAVAVAVENVLKTNGAVRNLALFFYIGMEGISILENAVRMGVGVPDKLKESLVQLKEGNKKEM